MTLRSHRRCRERARKIYRVEPVGDDSPPRHSAVAAYEHPVLKCSNKLEKKCLKELALAILDYTCSTQRAFVVELLSLTTTTQKLQAAHAGHLSTVTMSVTANKRYNDATIEPDNPGNVSNERSSYHVGNLTLDRHWW